MRTGSLVIRKIVVILHALTLSRFDIDERNFIVHITRYRLLAKSAEVRDSKVVPVYAEPLHLITHTHHLLAFTVAHPFLYFHHLLVLITRDVNAIDTFFCIGDEFSEITVILPLAYTHSYSGRKCQAESRTLTVKPVPFIVATIFLKQLSIAVILA